MDLFCSSFDREDVNVLVYKGPLNLGQCVTLIYMQVTRVEADGLICHRLTIIPQVNDRPLHIIIIIINLIILRSSVSRFDF